MHDDDDDDDDRLVRLLIRKRETMHACNNCMGSSSGLQEANEVIFV